MRSADTVEPAEWIAPACRGVVGTVGGFVPNQYPVVLRVRAPDPNVEDWWSAYCALFAVIASIGERHTSSPNRAWFAVWEGHGFDTVAAVPQIPSFRLPQREDYLLAGPVSAASRIEYPGWEGWHNPDLFWPNDRRWFVATDVDFWSLYIAGDHDFITELAQNVPTDSELVAFDVQLEAEL